MTDSGDIRKDRMQIASETRRRRGASRRVATRSLRSKRSRVTRRTSEVIERFERTVTHRMIPLFHDFRGLTVLVFGGGTVGMRKAERFASEARVIVVSPEFAGERPDDAALIRAAPTATDVRNWIDRTSPALVVAATDDGALNAAIETAARDAGVLVNRADQHGHPGPGGVVVPATVRDGPVVAAIATGGKSPALSKRLCDRIESDLDGAGRMVELTADIRTELQRREFEPTRRREAVRTLVDSSRVWRAVRKRDADGRATVQDVTDEVTVDAADDRTGADRRDE